MRLEWKARYEGLHYCRLLQAPLMGGALDAMSGAAMLREVTWRE
jgi:hypothetical protein